MSRKARIQIPETTLSVPSPTLVSHPFPLHCLLVGTAALDNRPYPLETVDQPQPIPITSIPAVPFSEQGAAVAK